VSNELYHLNIGPFQFANKAGEEKYEKVESVLKRLLHKGWFAARKEMNG
jgi:hypothetical protein